MLILRGSSVSIVIRLDGIMIGVLLPTEQCFYFCHSFQTGCRVLSPSLLPIGYLGLFYSGRWSWNFKELLEVKNFVSQIWLILSAFKNI